MLYSDIIVPVHAVGFGIDVAPGTGPVATEPLRTSRRLRRLRPLQPDDIAYVAETVALVAGELGAATPVLAFAGAPFTVASYLVEGRPSRTYEHTKALLHTDPGVWHALMEHLAAMAVEFVDVQLSRRGHGVPAVRLLGRNAARPPTTSASSCLTRGACSPSWPSATRECPASISASVATTSSSRWPPPAPG